MATVNHTGLWGGAGSEANKRVCVRKIAPLIDFIFFPRNNFLMWVGGSVGKAQEPRLPFRPPVTVSCGQVRGALPKSHPVPNCTKGRANSQSPRGCVCHRNRSCSAGRGGSHAAGSPTCRGEAVPSSLRFSQGFEPTRDSRVWPALQPGWCCPPLSWGSTHTPSLARLLSHGRRPFLRTLALTLCLLRPVCARDLSATAVPSPNAAQRGPAKPQHRHWGFPPQAADRKAKPLQHMEARGPDPKAQPPNAIGQQSTAAWCFGALLCAVGVDGTWVMPAAWAWVVCWAWGHLPDAQGLAQAIALWVVLVCLRHHLVQAVVLLCPTCPVLIQTFAKGSPTGPRIVQAHTHAVNQLSGPLCWSFGTILSRGFGSWPCSHLLAVLRDCSSATVKGLLSNVTDVCLSCDVLCCTCATVHSHPPPYHAGGGCAELSYMGLAAQQQGTNRAIGRLS